MATLELFTNTKSAHLKTNCLILSLLMTATGIVGNGLGAETSATSPSTFIPAFPGAEGYGAKATGGRGGRVISVTNLNDSGPGSLRAAVREKGPRIVVFRVSGTIPLQDRITIRNDDITIAGQTAPGDGICLKGALAVGANNVIVRYIRCRQDTVAQPQGDGIGGRYQHDIILDHVSASWSGDETMSLYHNNNVTIQWCMITEACAKFIDGKDTGHQFGGIWGNDYGTYHHNLIADNASRNPRWASGCGYNDYRNNVLYNWKYQSSYGGEAAQTGMEDRFNFSTINMIANYYKAGPATDEIARRRIVEPSEHSPEDKGSWYVADNHVDGYPEVTADNWKGVDGQSYIKLNAPWPAMAIRQQTPQEAYEAVLAQAGCSKPVRDSLDTTIVHDVAAGTATYGDNGILTRPADAGGWPELKSLPAPKDSDGDGMPDAWEVKYGLNPHDAADASLDKDKDGYTNVEEYLNGTDPSVFVDYTKPENNVNTLH